MPWRYPPQSNIHRSLIRKITEAVSIPVVACGGAGSLSDLKKAVYAGGASAVSAGSMFVFHGRHQAVLINFPTQKEIKDYFNQLIILESTIISKY